MSAETESVVGIVATYKRPLEFKRLLDSLAADGTVRRLVVVDNGSDSETEQVCRASPIPVQYHRPSHNLGCGGGVGRGLSLALQDGSAGYLCLFDDDAEVAPGAVRCLFRGMKAASADLAVPLVESSEGRIILCPGLTQRTAFQTFMQPGLTAAQFLAQRGPDPLPFHWAPWPILALTSRVVKECGYPREDFWLVGEDLEYTLRLTFRHLGVLVPEAVCRHLPPSRGATNNREADYLRRCLMVQNFSYLSTRLPHGRRGLRYVPGHYYWMFRNFGWRPTVLRDALLAAWRGGVCGKPGGTAGYDQFKQRFLHATQHQNKQAEPPDRRSPLPRDT